VKYWCLDWQNFLKWAWSRSRDLFKFWKIIDNILEMVPQRHCYNGRLNHVWPIECDNCQWPWVRLKVTFAGLNLWYFVQSVLIVILLWCRIINLLTAWHIYSGQALRTGRTMETYDEARQLSAKQRAALPSKKYPSNDNIYSYRFIFYSVLNILWCVDYSKFSWAWQFLHCTFDACTFNSTWIIIT